jgi:hypothetical protein
MLAPAAETYLQDLASVASSTGMYDRGTMSSFASLGGSCALLWDGRSKTFGSGLQIKLAALVWVLPYFETCILLAVWHKEQGDFAMVHLFYASVVDALTRPS